MHIFLHCPKNLSFFVDSCPAALAVLYPAANPAIVYVSQKLWLTVQQIPGHQIQSHSADYINNGVLFDEHGGKYNGYGDNAGDPYRPRVLLQCGGMSHRSMHGDGVKYMNTRKYICRCIGRVDHDHQPGKYIISWKNSRP